METIDHIFVGCKELIDIWSQIAIWWDVHPPDHFTITNFFVGMIRFSLGVHSARLLKHLFLLLFLVLMEF